MRKITQTTEKVISKIAIPVIIAAGMLLITALVLTSQGTTNQNNAYIRVINCIVSYNANERKQSDIDNCYKTLERDLGITLQRYDSSSL